MNKSKPYSLGKTSRLKSRKQIDGLFESGRKMSLFPFRVMYQTEIGKADLKAGFTASSRVFSRAVDRNRIKRLLRESYRRQKSTLEDLTQQNKIRVHLFFIYTSRDILSYEEISVKLNQLLAKLIRVIHEETATNT